MDFDEIDIIVPKRFPSVSIILPIRNEAAYIQRTLLAILEQDYLGEMEILIADGLSTDGTRQKIEQMVSALPASVSHPPSSVVLLDNPGEIVPTGMNVALRQTRGEIIIRADGHCILAPDYVRRCVEHLKCDGIDGVGGPMESLGETRIAQAIALGMSSPFGVGNSAFRTMAGGNLLVDTVPFPAYTRQIIERVGLYDEELVRNQDDEYNYRIRKMGGKILLAKDVRSAYFSRTSLKGLWRQYYQYGYWKVRVLQKHPRQMSLRQFVPPVFVFALFFSLFLVTIPATRFFSILLPGLYLLTNLFASVYTAFGRGWKYLPLLPVTFAILHLSYGSGFLMGFLKFWNRWGDKIGKVPTLIHESA